MFAFIQLPSSFTDGFNVFSTCMYRLHRAQNWDWGEGQGEEAREMWQARENSPQRTLGMQPEEWAGMAWKHLSLPPSSSWATCSVLGILMGLRCASGDEERGCVEQTKRCMCLFTKHGEWPFSLQKPSPAAVVSNRAFACCILNSLLVCTNEDKFRATRFQPSRTKESCKAHLF